MNSSNLYKEKQLVIFLKQGDVKAFEILFNNYQKPLYAFALRYVKINEDAEGIIQEVFIKLWQHRDKLNPDLSIKSYLYTITKNFIIDHFRRKKKELISDNYIRNLIEVTKSRPNVDRILDKKNHQLKKAINKLPERRRTIFLLIKKYGLSRIEAARFLNISEHTVKNQLQQAVQFLKKNIPNEILSIFIM